MDTYDTPCRRVWPCSLKKDSFISLLFLEKTEAATLAPKRPVASATAASAATGASTARPVTRKSETVFEFMGLRMHSLHLHNVILKLSTNQEEAQNDQKKTQKRRQKDRNDYKKMQSSCKETQKRENNTHYKSYSKVHNLNKNKEYLVSFVSFSFSFSFHLSFDKCQFSTKISSARLWKSHGGPHS